MPIDNTIKVKSDTAKEELNVQFNGGGKSGTLYSSLILDEDHIRELQGPEGHEIYAKMLRSDTQVRKVYYAISNPIKSALWDIEPASEEKKDIEAAALIKHILFENLPRGFKAKLDEILTFPFHGYSAFEVIFQNREDAVNGKYTGLKNLAFRDQKTLIEWRFNRDDETLEEVHQKQIGDLEVDTWIKGENLLIFYNEKKGSDLGFPIFRVLYGPYKRKLMAKQLQMIGCERSALPIPKLQIPKNIKVGSEEYAAAVRQLENYTNAENAYFLFPEGYELDFDNTNSFDPSKIQTVIKAENEDMMSAVLATFLEMGIGGNSGNQAATETLADFYTKGITYLADAVKDTLNDRVIPKLCELNFGDTLDALPKLTYAGITEDAGKEMMEIITGYTQAGVIAPDETLEDYARKIHDMPKKMEGELLDNKESQDDKTTEDDDTIDPPPSNNGDDKEVELSAKDPKTPRTLITSRASEVNEIIKDSLTFSAGKYINDTIAKYKDLPDGKKQKATDKIIMGGKNKLKKSLKIQLNTAAIDALTMVKKEVPASGDIKLSSKPEDILRVNYVCKNKESLSFADSDELPAHIRILTQKQGELIAEDQISDLETILDFKFSNSELNTNDFNVIKGDMEKAADDYINSGARKVVGTNVASTIVNESRNTWFFHKDIVSTIHSFTFVNISPVTPICKELAGTVFATNDAASLAFTPPLHHNCKSYLRANLKSSKGLPEISSLSPTAKAKESITL